VAIKILLRTLQGGQFSRFSYYCWCVGVAGILGFIIMR
jgi:undecaprenyl pyrophosphate phosphatase UppP